MNNSSNLSPRQNLRKDLYNFFLARITADKKPADEVHREVVAVLDDLAESFMNKDDLDFSN